MTETQIQIGNLLTLNLGTLIAIVALGVTVWKVMAKPISKLAASVEHLATSLHEHVVADAKEKGEILTTLKHHAREISDLKKKDAA